MTPLPARERRSLHLREGDDPRSASVNALGFDIERRAGVPVVVFDSGGCHPASDSEVALWARVQELEVMLEIARVGLEDLAAWRTSNPNPTPRVIAEATLASMDDCG